MNDTRRFLRLAYLYALASPDPSSQNGAVATRDGLIVGGGCNTFPEGVEQTAERWERPLKYEYVVHAEVAAMLGAFVRGEKPDTIWCCIPACANCAKHLIAGGVRRVVGHLALADRYDASGHWSKDRLRGLAMLEEAGVAFDWYNEPIDARPIRVNGELFYPGDDMVDHASYAGREGT